MKKVISVLLTAAILIGVCGISFSASALQFPKVNDKITEKYTRCLSNSDSNGLVYVEVYFDVVPMTEDEKDDFVYEKCGIRNADLIFTKGMTEEEQQIRRTKMDVYYPILNKLNNGLADQNAAPFFEQMGITLQYNNNKPIYHNRRILKKDTSLEICLTKAEVFQAAELDYVQGIVCYKRLTDTKYRTLLFENTLGWENVYAFGWDWNSNKFNGDYPGALINEKITDEEGKEYYAVRIPKYSTESVIMSNGEDEYTTEITFDEIRWGDYYAYRPEGTMGDNGYNIVGFHRSGSTADHDIPGDGNIVLLDNYNWKEAYIYALDKDGNELYGAFPGKKAKRFLDYGGMQFQITVPEGAASIVVSNGNDKKTVEITDLDPEYGYPYGYSLSTKNDAGDYMLNLFSGFLEPPGDGDYDEYFEPDPESKIGDVNGDNDVNVLDAVDIQKYSSDNLVFTDEQKHTGDYNKDGVCDILDATAIQTALVK